MFTSDLLRAQSRSFFVHFERAVKLKPIFFDRCVLFLGILSAHVIHVAMSRHVMQGALALKKLSYNI